MRKKSLNGVGGVSVLAELGKKISKSIISITKLSYLVIISLLRARRFKNFYFWHYAKSLTAIVEYLNSSDFYTQMKFKKLFDDEKHLADLERSKGNQAARDIHNTSLATKIFNQHQREFYEKNPTRLLGSEFTQSFGHLAWGVGYRIKARILGLTKTNYLMLGSNLANSWIVKNYWSEHLPYIQFEDNLLKFLEITNSFLFDDIEILQVGERFYGAEVGASLVDEEWNNRFPGSSLLNLKDEDRKYGFLKLKEFGFGSIDWFVTFHFRKRGNEESRNPNSKTYIRAIETIINEGGHVFCIGDGGYLNEVIKSRKFFDFGMLKSRDERLDVFLLAACRFMVGSSSGPLDVPPLFGKGVLWTNCSNLVMNNFHNDSIMIPRFRTRGDRPKFDEFVADIKHGLYENDSLPSWASGLQLDANTSVEIEEGVKEMFKLEWNIPPGDKEKVISDTIKQRGGVSSSNRISKYFLHSNFG
jgi:putative glycosyltransferase (TIGR04372 family)